MMQKNQANTPIFDALKKVVDRKDLSFHVPSHQNGTGACTVFKEFLGETIFKMDQTEIHDLDDLHNPKGVILEAQALASELWGAEKTFFLVNGTTGGIIASILSVAHEGEKVIIPRNAHKSVYTALILSGIEPVYMMPAYSKDEHIVCNVEVSALERTIEKHKDVKCLFLVHPSYYGICSNIKKLVEIAHENNMIVIVDEAHGGHFNFGCQLPVSAMEVGADISIQSTHKMSGSFTQSSMLHTKGNRVNLTRLKSALEMVQSTSPSYLLMASLDTARKHMALYGEGGYQILIEKCQKARKMINEIPGIYCMDDKILMEKGAHDYDKSKLVISAWGLGIKGYALHQLLYENHAIECEFADAYYVVCICGIGCTWNHLDNLVSALSKISLHKGFKKLRQKDVYFLRNVPEMVILPREAYFSQKKRVKWEDARNCISGEMIIPYPPGIPIVCQGERITDEIWEIVEVMRNQKIAMHGIADPALKTIDIVNRL